MQPSWLSLMPPLIVICSAFITRKLNTSLFIGIISSGLIAAQWSAQGTFTLVLDRFWGRLSDMDNIYLYSFLLIVGIIIVLINQTGGAIAFAHTITKRLRDSRAAQSSSILLSFLLFIDDYLSILTVGHVMQPITDRFAISRLKLAFLVHSLAGSVVILSPVSSWVAAINAYLDQAGIGADVTENVKVLADPFYIYLRTIPFTFYSFLVIGSVWFIVRRNISFGPMKTHETPNTHSQEPQSKSPDHQSRDRQSRDHRSGTIADLLLPIGTLLFSVIIGIAYSGGYYLLGGEYSLLEAFKNNQETFLIMFIASMLALSIGVFFGLARNTLRIQELPDMTTRGIQLMYEPVIMVFLASTLGILMKDDLQTGRYLAHLLLGSVSVNLLPVMFFIVSLLTTLATGSAWGTFALMILIAIQMLTTLLQVPIPTDPAAIPVLFPVLGAIFSGAVCGDHISPMSETTIMTATSTNVSPLEHAYTQLPYALPAVLCTALAFLISGYLINYSAWVNVGISLGVSMGLCLGMLAFLNIKK